MKKITTLLFAVFAFSCLYGQEKVKIAVFETSGAAKASIREELKEALIDGLYNNPAVTVLDRSALEQVMKEKAMQVSDDFDESQAVELGKMAGAKYICVSSINSVDGFEYTIIYRLVDVETGEILVRERKKAGAGELRSTFDKISKSKLFAAGSDNAQAANNTEISICGCEIATADLPEDAKIPAGWRLPTLSELECMCKNKDQIGGFNFGTYLSSTREQSYAKGIKFQFCDETIVTGNSSRRVVRGGKTVQSQSVEEKPSVSKTIAPAIYGETTLRTGLELGLESGLGYSVSWENMPFSANIIAGYRFAPQMAAGLGLGVSQFAFFDYNFNDTKFSPFARVELGLMPYTYEYYDYSGYSSYSESGSGSSFYAGAQFGFRYSFNYKWALQAGAKAFYSVAVEDFTIGLNAGVVFHW